MELTGMKLKATGVSLSAKSLTLCLYVGCKILWIQRVICLNLISEVIIKNFCHLTGFGSNTAILDYSYTILWGLPQALKEWFHFPPEFSWVLWCSSCICANFLDTFAFERSDFVTLSFIAFARFSWRISSMVLKHPVSFYFLLNFRWNPQQLVTM